MKMYCVVSSNIDVEYSGSWYGCLHYCKQAGEILKIIVVRAGEAGGCVVAETGRDGLRLIPDGRLIKLRSLCFKSTGNG